MISQDLYRPLALVGNALTTQVSTRFLGLLPEGLRDGVQSNLASVGGIERGEMTVVEQVLCADLDVIFDEQPDVEEEWAEVLPLRVADVLALVVPANTPQQAADLLRRLPTELESQVLHLVSAQGWHGLERRLGHEELDFMSALASEMQTEKREADPDFVAEVLRQGQSTGILRQVLTQMYDMDPDSTGKVQNALFGFNDLAILPDRELQAVLRGVDHWDLILSLGSAPAGLRRKVLANISKRRAGLFEEDEAQLEQVDEAQVEMVQNQIVHRARMLYEAGTVRTYLGSVARGESQVEGEEVREYSPQDKSSIARKPEKRNYKRGIVALVFIVVSGWIAWTWLLDMGSRTSSQSGGRAKLVGSGQDTVTAPVERRSRKGQTTGKGAGKVATISGQGLLISGQKVTSSENRAVEPGDRLQTGQDGQASVQMGGNEIEVEAESDVEFGEEGSEGAPTPRLDLRAGNIWVEVDDPDLKVTSPIVEVTASEGARYHFVISLNATTTVTVHSGSVTVRPVIDSEIRLLVLGAGERTRITSNGEVKREFHRETPIWDKN